MVPTLGNKTYAVEDTAQQALTIGNQFWESSGNHLRNVSWHGVTCLVTSHPSLRLWFLPEAMGEWIMLSVWLMILYSIRVHPMPWNSAWNLSIGFLTTTMSRYFKLYVSIRKFLPTEWSWKQDTQGKSPITGTVTPYQWLHHCLCHLRLATRPMMLKIHRLQSVTDSFRDGYNVLNMCRGNIIF